MHRFAVVEPIHRRLAGRPIDEVLAALREAPWTPDDDWWLDEGALRMIATRISSAAPGSSCPKFP
jgi:hypothetical protein